MTEESLKDLIADKKKFIEHVESTIVKEESDIEYGLKEKSCKDELGREVFWEYNNSYVTRQYSIYPSKELNIRVAYFTSEPIIAFINTDGRLIPKEEFFKLLNKNTSL